MSHPSEQTIKYSLLSHPKHQSITTQPKNMKFLPISIISAALLLSVPSAVQANTSKAESLHKTFEEISNQPCDDRKSFVEKGSVYSACTANAGGRGQFRFISASQHIAEAPDVGGIVYWYYLNGKVAVITFAHDGTSFMFDQSGKLQAQLIFAQKVMVNGREQFQKRSIGTSFTKAERDHLEKLAKGGGAEILSKFQQKQSKTNETPALWSHCKRVIDENITRLEAIPNVKVTTSSRFSKLLTPYPDRSANLNRRYVFAMEGRGVETVWKSDDLMTEITKDITNACVDTAAVTFGRDRTSDSATVGLFPDGSVKKFTCGADFDSRTLTRPPMAWGQQSCD